MLMSFLSCIVAISSRLPFRLAHANTHVRHDKGCRCIINRNAIIRSKSSLPSSSNEITGSDVPDLPHIPVMKNECIDYLQVHPGGVYVDCTMGFGGHTSAILEKGGTVIGLDQDPDAIAHTSSLLSGFLQNGQLEIIQTNFRNIRTALRSSTIMSTRKGMDCGDEARIDGILMDLGISSYQIDQPTRGFSFSREGPIDMRMCQQSRPFSISDGDNCGNEIDDISGSSNSNGSSSSDSSSSSSSGSNLSSPIEGASTRAFSAATIVNEWATDAIADVLYNFGEERKSRQIARDIVLSRPLNSTRELEWIIGKRVSAKERPKVLARCFQALRIAVNDEMGALDEALKTIHMCLRPGGRLVVLSYHSLEDRRIKNLFKTGSPAPVRENKMPELSDKSIYSPYAPSPPTRSRNSFEDTADSNPWRLVVKTVQGPSEEEILVNRRARSAKLRVAEVKVSGGGRLHKGSYKDGKDRERDKDKERLSAQQADAGTRPVDAIVTSEGDGNADGNGGDGSNGENPSKTTTKGRLTRLMRGRKNRSAP